MHHLSSQKFLHFHAFLGGNCQIIGWCPPLGLAHPSGKSWIHHWTGCTHMRMVILYTPKELEYVLKGPRGLTKRGSFYTALNGVILTVELLRIDN